MHIKECFNSLIDRGDFVFLCDKGYFCSLKKGQSVLHTQVMPGPTDDGRPDPDSVFALDSLNREPPPNFGDLEAVYPDNNCFRKMSDLFGYNYNDHITYKVDSGNAIYHPAKDSIQSQINRWDLRKNISLLGTICAFIVTLKMCKQLANKLNEHKEAMKIAHASKGLTRLPAYIKADISRIYVNIERFHRNFGMMTTLIFISDFLYSKNQVSRWNNASTEVSNLYN